MMFLLLEFFLLRFLCFHLTVIIKSKTSSPFLRTEVMPNISGKMSNLLNKFIERYRRLPGARYKKMGPDHDS